MSDDIYAIEGTNGEQSSLRFIHITVRNVLGILNRIVTLLRRKRYFIEDVSVTFDEKKLAHIVLVIDAKIVNVEQVMRQVHKIHDVVDVSDMTVKEGKLYEAIYVYVDTEEDLKKLPEEPMRTIRENGSHVGVYMLKLTEAPQFIQKLEKSKHRYLKRLIAMV